MPTKCSPWLIFFLTACLLLPACTGSRDDELACTISDQVRFLREFESSGDHYYLYERISGWHDKNHYMELYDQKPEFDQCGEPNVALLSQLPVSDLGNNPVKIVIKDLLIDIEYGDYPYSNPDLSTIPIDVQ